MNLGAKRSEALRSASKFGMHECVALLLRLPGSDPAALQNEAVIFAARFGFAEVVACLVADPRVNCFDCGFQALTLAARFGHAATVRLLLDQFRRRQPRDRAAQEAVDAALRSAAATGKEPVVREMLLEGSADPAANRNEAIRLAAAGGHAKIVKMLMEDDRVNPADFGNRAVLIATEAGHQEIVQLLLTDPRVASSFKVSRATSLTNLLMCESDGDVPSIDVSTSDQSENEA